jgi:glycosyltransferase involved in cell wall biosynthesis
MTGVAPSTRRPEGMRRGAGSDSVASEEASGEAPVVLVHAGPPWQTNGGAVFLDAVASHVARPCVHLAISLDGHPLAVPTDFPRPVLQVAARGPMRGMGLLQRRVPWAARQLYWGALYPRQLEHETALVAASVLALRPSRLVYFLNALEVPLIATALSARVGVPYATMEWDLLDVAYERQRLSGPLERRLLARLAGVRQGAVARGVASEGMAAYYRETWGLDTVVLRQPAAARGYARDAGAGSPFVVAVCGNVYAGAEFRVLLAALDRLGWSAAGRVIELRVIGDLDPSVGAVPARVVVTGWVPYAEALARLRDADVGYCPYWFDPAFHRLVITSFPSKLIAYLSAGVPVFYHGPAGGTPAAFLARYPAGVSCHSLDPAEVATTLAGLVAAPAALAKARAAASRAIGEEFSAATFQHRLASWLGDAPTGAIA